MIFIGVMFHNNEELVDPFFYFLRKSSSGLDYRVIALDNGSSDKTRRKVFDKLQGGDRLITELENIGTSKARNKILNLAREINEGSLSGSYLVLLDSDVFIAADKSIKRMVATFDHSKSIGIVYGETISFFDWKNKASGMCFCTIRGELIDRIGDFDERFFCYYDDADLYLRAEQVGYFAPTCKEAKCVHAWGETLWRGESDREETKALLAKDNAEFNSKWNRSEIWDADR